MDVVQQYLDTFATADPDAVAALVTDDFVNEHLSELGSGCAGRDEYRRRLPGFLSTFAGARYVVEAIGPLGDADVVARYRFQAEYEGMPDRHPRPDVVRGARRSDRTTHRSVGFADLSAPDRPGGLNPAPVSFPRGEHEKLLAVPVAT